MATENSFKVEDRMSAAALKTSQDNSPIKFKRNPKKDNSLFFTCGDVVGAIGKQLQAAFNSDKNLTVDDMEFCKLVFENKTIPCLMLASANVAAEF